MIFRICLICACVLFAAARWFIPTHGLSWAGSYEAMAHILVGFLIGAAWYAWENGNKEQGDCAMLLFLAGSLTSIEVLAFFLSR